MAGKLRPGRYIRDEHGTVHPYNEHAMSVATGIQVFTVTADQSEVVDDPVTPEDRDDMSKLVSLMMSGEYPVHESGPHSGKVNIGAISDMLGFKVTKVMIQAALDEVAAIQKQVDEDA